MAVKYRIYQLKNSTEGNAYNGKWYARAVVDEVTDTQALAELIQRNCSVKRSDVMAVLTELSEVLKDELLAGNRIKIDGIGSFKAGFTSKPADTRAEWTPQTNITGTHIVFQPESVVTIAGGHRTRSVAALQGLEFTELRGYDDGKDDSGTGSGGEEEGGGGAPLG